MQSSQRMGVIIVTCGVLIAGIVVWYGADPWGDTSTPDRVALPAAPAAASMEGGRQYVAVTAHGGYTPRTTRAVAGEETVIRIRTEDTYDCSSAVAIPALGFEATLGPNEVREVVVPAEKAQGTLNGLCSMGMYRFSVVFE